MKTLVGYGTAERSTRGIAEHIASGLDHNGDVVEVRRLAEVNSVGDYETIVVGGASRNGQWLTEVDDAVERVVPHLTGRALWAYAVSSVGTTSTLPLAAAGTVPAPSDPRTQSQPYDRRAGSPLLLGGTRPGDWPGFGRIVFRLMGGHYGDARDWTDGDKWVAVIHTGVMRGRR